MPQSGKINIHFHQCWGEKLLSIFHTYTVYQKLVYLSSIPKSGQKLNSWYAILSHWSLRAKYNQWVRKPLFICMIYNFNIFPSKQCIQCCASANVKLKAVTTWNKMLLTQCIRTSLNYKFLLTSNLASVSLVLWNLKMTFPFTPIIWPFNP